jgi:hypothetical protein
MAGLMDLLNSDLGKQIIGSISQQTGIDSNQAGAVVANGLPEILARMQQNTENGDSGLLGALLGGKHDGSILDNIGGYLNNSQTADDGSKILGHVFGDDKSTLENGLSEKTGVDSGIIAKILPMLMPIIMGYLGKQASSNGVQDTGGLGSILGGLLGGGNQQQSSNSNSSLGGSILTSVLDQDGDGQIGIGDAVSAMSGKGKSGGFLGGLLGNLFGKK